MMGRDSPSGRHLEVPSSCEALLIKTRLHASCQSCDWLSPCQLYARKEAFLYIRSPDREESESQDLAVEVRIRERAYELYVLRGQEIQAAQDREIEEGPS